MNVRNYSPSDWPRLCEIHDAARKQELEASGLPDAFLTLEENAENEGLFDGLVLVAEVNGVVSGFIGSHEGEITWLYVDPSHQQRGIAKTLLRAARELSVGPLVLEVLVGNDAALQFYLCEGFRVVDRANGKLAGNESFPASAYVLRHEGDA